MYQHTENLVVFVIVCNIKGIPDKNLMIYLKKP